MDLDRFLHLVVAQSNHLIDQDTAMAKKERTLKGALEREKGVDHKKLHQKKLQKQAEKRKAKKQRSEVDVAALEDVVDGADEDEIEVEEFADDAAEADREALAAEIAQMMEKVRGGEEYELETDGSEDAELEVDGEYAEEEEDDGGVELEALDDEGGDEVESDEEEGGELNLETFEDESESDEDETFYTAAGGSPEKARTNGLPTEDDDAEGEDDEDIPLSDIDSLASDEKDDVVPYQRLTINNTAALTRSLKSFALPSSLPFSAVQSITSSTPTQAASIPDPEDDLNRELAFYSQSLSAVREARIALKKEGVPFSRPADYFAEMVKSEEQMGKVRQKMVDEAARKKASSDARRQRDLKKFGKAVQVAKLQERDRAKRETLDKIQSLKRSEFIQYYFPPL